MLLSLAQYKLAKSELNSRTLSLSVWDWDRFGRNQFLGEIHIPLASLDLTISSSEWYNLQDKVHMYTYTHEEFYVHLHMTRTVASALQLLYIFRTSV